MLEGPFPVKIFEGFSFVSMLGFFEFIGMLARCFGIWVGIWVFWYLFCRDREPVEKNRKEKEKQQGDQRSPKRSSIGAVYSDVLDSFWHHAKPFYPAL